MSNNKDIILWKHKIIPKIMGIILFVFCSLNIFGCFQPSKSKSQNSPSVGQKKKIVVWHWMTDRHDYFLELAKKYKDLTGVEVVFELYAPSDAYSQKIRAAGQAFTIPDIFGILAEKRDFGAFVKAGHLADLSQELNKDNGAWRKQFVKGALEVNEFLPNNEFGVKPGIYGIPIDIMTIQLLYNKKLFRQAGLDPDRPPRTWDEFIAAARKLRDAGIQGLVSGWGEIWMIYCFATNYAFNIMGEEKVFATFRGEVPYTDPDWIQVFSLFKQLSDENLLATGIVTMVNKKAEQTFANELAAFAFNGSWCVNVYEGMNPNLDYGVIMPPSFSQKYPMKIWGAAGSSFVVNDRSLRKNEAIAFLKWLTMEEQQLYLLKTTKNPPSNKNCLTKISPLLYEFTKQMDNSTHPNIWPAHEFPVVIERFNKGIQSIIIKEKTPEQLGRELQELKEQELKRQKEK